VMEGGLGAFQAFWPVHMRSWRGCGPADDEKRGRCYAPKVREGGVGGTRWYFVLKDLGVGGTSHDDIPAMKDSAYILDIRNS
jgi:hypothetical protein